MKRKYFWLTTKISEYLKKRLSENQIESLRSIEDRAFESISSELQDSITLYNRLENEILPNPLISPDLVNSIHLKSIYNHNLPDYLEIFEKVKKDTSLQQMVFGELRDSEYFRDVYTIADSQHLLVNIMILIYRNAMLYLHPELRLGKAQISSTIEEMSALHFLQSNKSTLLFESVKHWILQWESEGFSRTLATLL